MVIGFETPRLTITREVKTSHTFVRRVVRSFNVANLSICIPQAYFAEPKTDTHVLNYIEAYIN